MREAVILSAVRLPTGKFMGALKGFRATELGAMVVREAVRRARVEPDRVDEVIMGNVLSAGLGQAPARQAAIKAGLPPRVGALTINKVCGSGLKAVMLAAQAVATGDADVVVAGGMESMSNAPYLLPKAREGMRLGHGELVDSMVQAQEAQATIDSEGVVWPSKASLYAVMALQSEINPRLLNIMRDLAGGSIIMLPSSVKDFENPEIAADLERYIASPGFPSRLQRPAQRSSLTRANYWY